MTHNILEANNHRWWPAVLTGVPYAIYKVATGYYLWQVRGLPLGILLMLWGCFDCVTNILTIIWQRQVPYCLLALTGHYLDIYTYWKGRRAGRSAPADARPFRWEELGLGVDTLASFFLVSYMIWNRHIPEIVPVFGRLWDLAVISNIIGVGLSRILTALNSPGSPVQALVGSHNQD